MTAPLISGESRREMRLCASLRHRFSSGAIRTTIDDGHIVGRRATPRLSSSAKADDPVFQRCRRSSREAAAYWMPAFAEHDSACECGRRMTTTPRSRLQRLQKPHRLAQRRRQQFALPHHAAAAHEGADRPARDLHAVIRRPAGARGDPLLVMVSLALQIDDGEVGVVAGRDAALAGDAEEPRRAGAGQIDEALPATAARH